MKKHRGYASRCITKYDAMFLFEILIAIVVNNWYLHMDWNWFTVFTIAGLSFELLTRSSWRYSKEFRRSILVIDGSDVSMGAAFSWAAVLTSCLALAALTEQLLPGGPRQLYPVLSIGVVGNILETVCHRWGMFRYRSTWITRFLFFRRPVMLRGVPLAVRLGYFLVFGVACSFVYIHIGG